MTERNNELFIKEANSFFNRYYELTGNEFPPCNQADWNSLDEWFADLKVAVYREEAMKAINNSENSSKLLHIPSDRFYKSVPALSRAE